MLTPALKNIDSSSGAIGTAVDNALAPLVPFVTSAPADAETRTAWLERLFAGDLKAGWGRTPLAQPRYRLHS